MKINQLEPIENEMLKDIENERFRSIENVGDEIARVREMVTKQNTKDQRMNIRISGADLDRLKAKALEEGLPYQTLVTSILHKYVHGKLKKV